VTRSALESVLRRAMNDCDDVTAARVAVLLTPWVDAEAELEDDRHPSPIPIWSCYA